MHGSREEFSAGARILYDTKEWFFILANAITWFYSYPPEKFCDTRRWLCAGGKHTATCDRVTNCWLKGRKMVLRLQVKESRPERIVQRVDMAFKGDVLLKRKNKIIEK